MKHTALLLAALILPAGLADAQENNEFILSAQLRPRTEYRDGALMPRDEGVSAAFFTNSRARLSMEYRSPLLSMKFSSQYVGVWGQDPQIDKNGRFVMNEAWARLGAGEGFFAQLGRQTLSYDDERLLGGLDWNVAGRHHDALKLGYQTARHKVHLILAFNQNDEKVSGGTYYNMSTAQPYKTMQTLWYHYKPDGVPFEASLLFMNLGRETGTREKPGTAYMQTAGTHLSYSPGRWNFAGSFYYQAGKVGMGAASSEPVRVCAYMWSVVASRRIGEAWTLTAGSDYLSGNGGEADKYTAFDPLYGTHHKFYGAMDYFYASAWKTGSPGLWDNRVGVSYKASPKVVLQANYHYFSTACQALLAESLGRALGSEVDTQLDWSIMKDVKLSAGYSFMLGTKTMDAVKGGDHKSWQGWGWVSVNINPRLFSAKW